MVEEVVSGGQTGVDRMGLETAKILGIKTGGFVPKGWRTEKGPDLTLKEFGLVETQSEGYTLRTLLNVLNSDGTVLFGDIRSAGSQQTIANLITNKKPYVVNPTIEGLVEFIQVNSVKKLNVAGNRGSKVTVNQYREYQMVLAEALKQVLATKPLPTKA